MDEAGEAMRREARRIVLVDLDGTLLHVPLHDGVIAGALDEATGRPGLLAQHDFHGRPDRWLTAEVARTEQVDEEALFRRYAAAYTRRLGEALAPYPPSALPGAATVLAQLRERPNTALGVATGNIQANALIKLRHALLDGYFDPLVGGFGDDYCERAEIVQAAASACGYADRDRVVVIGDTVHDVRAAVAVGARAVGVATGHATAAELAAAGATAVLSDLTAPAAMEAIIG